MGAIANFFASMTDIFSIWMIFDRFKSIQGWTLKEVAIIYGIIHVGFSIGESLSRGFEKFSPIVKNGEFDRVLLRPLGTLFQIATRETCWIRVGRFLQGLFVLLWGCSELGIHLFSTATFTICCGITGTICLFYGLFVLQATLAFWTTETLDIMNIVTYGGRDVGQYPAHIFPDKFRWFFTFVVPLSCVAYYPIASLLQHEHLPLLLGIMAPITGVCFLLISCRCWKFGVLHYHSTGH